MEINRYGKQISEQKTDIAQTWIKFKIKKFPNAWYR